MSELSSNAVKEEPRQTLTVDCRNARWHQPSDQPEPDHIQIPPQPITRETHAIIYILGMHICI